MSKKISDHRFLFPLMLISFFAAPFLVNFLGIPNSFTYPTVWMLGLLTFALGAYFLGTLIQVSSSTNKISNQKTRFFIIGILFLLLCLLFSRYGLPLPFGIICSIASVVLIHYLLTSHFTIRLSFILIALSLFLILTSFVVIGGIPLLSWNSLRRSAVLSPIREVALPLFLLGATSLAIKARNVSRGAGRHAIPFVLFLVGFTVFLSNGKRIDAAAILIGYLIYLLRTHSYKVMIPAIAFASGTGITVAYFQPSILALFRQSFNFQVLRHIISYVQHPLSGETLGAITFGINQHFLGPHLLYGEAQNWNLTSTWLGPGYFDFGLLGVLITMVGIAAILQFLLGKANSQKDNDKLETIYVVTLALMLSLFEEGLDLFGVVLLFAMFYAALSERRPKDPSSKVGKLAMESKSLSKPKKTIILIGLISAGLILTAASFEAEFHSYRTVHQTNIEQGTNVITSILANRYYQIKVFGGESAVGRLQGELNITGVGLITQHFKFDHLFWLSKHDVADVGWFKPEEAGSYTITVAIEQVPTSHQETIMKLTESPLSDFMPNYVMLGFGSTLVLVPLVFILFNMLRHLYEHLSGIRRTVKKPNSSK